MGDENSDVDDVVENDEEKMVDTDNEENIPASVIQLHENKERNVTEKSEKTVILTEDVSNMQLNRDKKKSFKNQQKEERKKLSKLVAAEETSMKVDDESSTKVDDESSTKVDDESSALSSVDK